MEQKSDTYISNAIYIICFMTICSKDKMNKS